VVSGQLSVASKNKAHIYLKANILPDCHYEVIKRSGYGKDWSRPAMLLYELPGAFKGHPKRVLAPAFALKSRLT
jgi:hypothetical protein